MPVFMKYRNNIWIAISVILLFSAISAGLSVALVFCFEIIRGIIPAIMIAVCLMGIVPSFLHVRKHPTRRKTQEMLVIAANYLLLLLSCFYYSIGFLWWLPLFSALIILIITNDLMSVDVSSTCLLQTNTVFAVPLASTFSGLLYASNISSDWGTLYVTTTAGVVYAAIGFVFSAFALLIKGFINRRQ